MKRFKMFITIAVIAATTAVLAVSFTGCGKTLEGTYTHTVAWDTVLEAAENPDEVFAGAGFWDMGISASFLNIDNYTMVNTIEFDEKGNYKYTMLSVLAASYDANFDREKTAYCEAIYTGTYTAGKDADTWTLAFPTECVWSYNAGMFSTPPVSGESSVNNKYSEGKKTMNWFGSMGKPGDVMTMFGREIQHLDTLPDGSTETDPSTLVDNTKTMTVTVNTKDKTFGYNK